MKLRALQILRVPALLSGSHVKAGLACLGLTWWLLTDSHHGTGIDPYLRLRQTLFPPESGSPAWGENHDSIVALERWPLVPDD